MPNHGTACLRDNPMPSHIPSHTHWLTDGSWITVRGRGGRHRLFVRQDGPEDGRPVTLIHGFPTSSHDWSLILPQLTDLGLRVTTLDLLGFGASDKPRRHTYSVMEQADLVEGVWTHLNIGDTAMVAHDYGVTVAQELLARNSRRVTRMVWLNGGLYPDLHRPLRIQRLLHGPFGPLLSHGINQKTFARSMRRLMARPASDQNLHEMWNGIALHQGHLLAPRLLRYIDERRAHETRWVTALEDFNAPTLFVWGPHDPISGAHVAQRIRQRFPHAHLRELNDPFPVGHYPQIEAPDEVGSLIGKFLSSPPGLVCD